MLVDLFEEVVAFVRSSIKIALIKQWHLGWWFVRDKEIGTKSLCVHKIDKGHGSEKL